MHTELEFNQALQIHKEAEQQKLENNQEFEQNLKDARSAVMDRIYNSNIEFSCSDIQDIMLDHGLEMDYIEQFI